MSYRRRQLEHTRQRQCLSHEGQLEHTRQRQCLSQEGQWNTQGKGSVLPPQAVERQADGQPEEPGAVDDQERPVPDLESPTICYESTKKQKEKIKKPGGLVGDRGSLYPWCAARAVRALPVGRVHQDLKDLAFADPARARPKR